jgi:hypothetical protein
MPAVPGLHEFIEIAKASGASDQSLVGVLTARGWPEKEVYDALAVHYERVTGIEVPRRGSAGTAAKDAFFHLLIFSTLATWTIGLGALAFTLIDRWLADSLFSQTYYPGYEVYSAAESMASVLVAFPIYLLVSRSVLRDESGHPEKLQSPVRKWLTYMALVIAACVFIGDLIAALTFFLRGEITSRFLAKAFVVLVISGGIFFYYFGGLRQSERPEPQSKWSRDRWMAGISMMIVAGMLILGFSHVGAPSTQRTLRADTRRVQDLYMLSSAIYNIWTSAHKLPEHLDELRNVALADPITRAEYEYRTKDASKYELCATFAMSSRENEALQRASTWSHQAGRQCFALDAAQMADNPNIYFPN